ncbi:hypothetical protein NDU88_006715 [Pleurodeles waltl]|uniref:Uncharacterized protein n=1 Tax=Pleurodeles waltl TaxID=8319 RepID=A0AAV7N4V2_PLEWA|nr:hypothetical protein NDU88_006715 [Pleurodeles waltl]
MPSKARRKQYTEGKPLTSRHPTRNQDAMEPKLQVQLMLVYHLIYQEHQRRRRQRRWVRDVSCSLGQLPTGDAADVRSSGTGWAHRRAGGGGCGGDAAGGACVCTCGGRHQAVSCSLGQLPLWMMLMSAVVALAGQIAGQVAVAAPVSVAEMLPVVQVSAFVEEDTRLSPAASEGCPLGMMLVTVVEAAAMQVAVQMAVQVAVVAAVFTAVQVAGLSCERGDTSPSPGGSVP